MNAADTAHFSDDPTANAESTAATAIMVVVPMQSAA
jgi:hypothetical protein